MKKNKKHIKRSEKVFIMELKKGKKERTRLETRNNFHLGLVQSVEILVIDFSSLPQYGSLNFPFLTNKVFFLRCISIYI